MDTYWNGQLTPAVIGTAVVEPTRQFPDFWGKHLVGQRIPVVRVVLDGVNFGGGVIYLDNRDGSGWLKVTVGRGGPASRHREVQVEAYSFQAMILPPKHDHKPIQHRDGKPPWCKECRLTGGYDIPRSMIKKKD